MMDPLQTQASHTVLHAWVSSFLVARTIPADSESATTGANVQEHAERLRESAVQLQLALEKMRIANEKLALRMAEHRAFFAKYHTPQKYRAE